ncbi:MAG: mercuric reductase [Nitrospirae bacterium]|nr:MAG: mercuric reductase [Nitrospirota bacterium]
MGDSLNIPPDDEHNRELVANVHPSGWTNPEPAERYNLVVLGAGTAGLVTAAGAAGLGARVALVEKHLMGGDCLNVGCVPSKALIRAARACAQVRDAAQFGVRVPDGVRYDFTAAMERVRKLRARISHNDSAHRFTKLGVDVFIGEGRFTGPDAVEVGGKTLRFAKAAICTGARAAAPPIAGIDKVPCLTNETVFSLTELPQRMAVIGAGAIGCELAQAFARFGCAVTLFEQAGTILPNEDAEAAELVREAMARDGVRFALKRDILQVLEHKDGLVIYHRVGGAVENLVVDEILLAAGRAPNVEGLDLEAAGVLYDRSGVLVNDELQTANPLISAAGDVCSRFKFTHAADAMARLVINNMLSPVKQKVSDLVIPWCTYTDPELAHVGLSEEEARAKGHKVETFTWKMDEVDRAILDGEEVGFGRVLVRKGTDKILGATIVAARAGDLISELTLAMTNGLGLGAVCKTIHPYPTQAEVVKRLGDAYNRTRLTPLVKTVLEKWLSSKRR